MSQGIPPFLRIDILKFQVNDIKHAVDLSKVKTEIEIKERNHLRQTCKLKRCF